MNFLIMAFLLVSFYSTGFSIQKTDTSKTAKVEFKKSDTTQYELIVDDPAFETYLVTQPPMDFYSKSYYKTWNTQYVIVWNDRFLSSRNASLYENTIDYDPKVDYGIELEYRLYNFFRFFEKKNNVILINRGH